MILAWWSDSSLSFELASYRSRVTMLGIDSMQLRWNNDRWPKKADGLLRSRSESQTKVARIDMQSTGLCMNKHTRSKASWRDLKWKIRRLCLRAKDCGPPDSCIEWFEHEWKPRDMNGAGKPLCMLRSVNKNVHGQGWFHADLSASRFAALANFETTSCYPVLIPAGSIPLKDHRRLIPGFQI